MKKYDIEITRSRINEDISKTTAYTASRIDVAPESTTSATAFDTVYATLPEMEAMDRYWIEGTTAISDAVKQFSTSCVTTDDRFELKMEMPSNFDNNNLKSLATIRNAMESYLTNIMIAKWYIIANKSDAEVYVRQADSAMSEIVRFIYHRDKPIRKKLTH